ncbi:hypothetical protein H6P81_012650 [Aristolochia fimbriata]|uniref:Uncharacterized protein n=1 Tax=Aristolochia fimbriata TaxID=158543 RepID=A0AAV7EFP1_ARIFI|nr:hypothetical protein H6P81_012650 [Aristolochia fimbriata]
MAPGKCPPLVPECSLSDIPKIGIEGVSDSSNADESSKIVSKTQLQGYTVLRKRGRGPSRGLTVEKLYEKLGHKILVEFDATSRRPKGKYSGEFIGYIGIAVKTRLPHQVRYFRKFKAENFHEAYAFIQNYFADDILHDNLCQEVVLRTMSDIFWAYKGELSAWFKQHGGDPEGRLTHFLDVDESDWKWLCDNIFATKSFQVLGSRSGYIKGQGQTQPAVPKRPRGASSSSSSVQNMIDQVR